MKRLVLLLSFLVSACAAFTAAKPVLRTLHDAATLMCQQYFGERQGLSLDDAARAYCTTDAQLGPFVDAILTAKQEAGELAATRAGLSRPRDVGDAGTGDAKDAGRD